MPNFCNPTVADLSYFTDDKVSNRRIQLNKLITARESLRLSNMYCINGEFDVPFEICKAIDLVDSQIKHICDELQISYKAS